MLTEVADGVWVRQSAWVWANSIVVRGAGLIRVIDSAARDRLAAGFGLAWWLWWRCDPGVTCTAQGRDVRA